MYVDTSHITRGGKTYTRHLLRESYRANGNSHSAPFSALLTPFSKSPA